MAAEETDQSLRTRNSNTSKPLAYQYNNNWNTMWNTPNMANWHQYSPLSLQSFHQGINQINRMGASYYGAISQLPTQYQQQHKYNNCNPQHPENLHNSLGQQQYNYRNAWYNNRSQTSLTQAKISMQRSQQNYLSRYSGKPGNMDSSLDRDKTDWSANKSITSFTYHGHRAYKSQEDLRENQRVAARKQLEILKNKLNPTETQKSREQIMIRNQAQLSNCVDTDIKITKRRRKAKYATKSNKLLLLKKDGSNAENKRSFFKKFHISWKSRKQSRVQLGELPSCSNQSTPQSDPTAPKESSKSGFMRRLFRLFKGKNQNK